MDYQPSRLASSLAHKYALKHFLSLTERTKAVLGYFLMFLVFAFTVAYFGAHIMLYITGYYDHTALTISHHIIK